MSVGQRFKLWRLAIIMITVIIIMISLAYITVMHNPSMFKATVTTDFVTIELDCKFTDEQ